MIEKLSSGEVSEVLKAFKTQEMEKDKNRSKFEISDKPSGNDLTKPVLKALPIFS